MADGMAWEDLTPELESPGIGIRRMDAGGLAMCLIRPDAGLKTHRLFAGLPDDRCQCTHWGYIVSGTMRVHGADGSRDYTRVRPTTGNTATTSRRSPTRSTSRSLAPTSTTR
jgi:hypothetical protein